MVNEKPQKKPPFTEAHENARLEFGRQNMNEEDWKTIIFSGENKFYLNGPDGGISYWHDLRTEKLIKISRNVGSGSVMVWGGFCKLALAFISTKMLQSILTGYAEGYAGWILISTR